MATASRQDAALARREPDDRAARMKRATRRHRPWRDARTTDGAHPRALARYFVFCAPTCWSQILNASTCAAGGSDCVCGNCVEPPFVLRPAELLDRVLAFLRRHRERHVLHRGAGIEVALVVRVGLRFRRQHVRHQVEDDGELLGRHALRHDHVVRVVDPRHALERRDLVVLRHDAEHARVDVPAGHRDRHVARALAQLLHDRAGAGRVVLDAGVELLEIRPGLFPAVDRVLRILVAEDVRQAHDERAAGTRVRRPRVDQLVGIRLAPGEELGRGRRHLLHLVRVVLDQRARRHERDRDALVGGELLHLRRGRLVVRDQVRELRRVFGQDLDQQSLFDAGGEEVGARQHEIDVAAARALHRLELARQFRRRRLGEVELGDEVRVLLRVLLDRVLRQREVAGDVDDVDRHRALRHRRNLRRCNGSADSGHCPRRSRPCSAAARCICVHLSMVLMYFLLVCNVDHAAPMQRSDRRRLPDRPCGFARRLYARHLGNRRSRIL